jgi:hypothetical protein
MPLRVPRICLDSPLPARGSLHVRFSVRPVLPLLPLLRARDGVPWFPFGRRTSVHFGGLLAALLPRPIQPTEDADASLMAEFATGDSSLFWWAAEAL